MLGSNRRRCKSGRSQRLQNGVFAMRRDPYDQESIRSHESEVQRLKNNRGLMVVKDACVFRHRGLAPAVRPRIVCKIIMVHCSIYVAMQHNSQKKQKEQQNQRAEAISQPMKQITE